MSIQIISKRKIAFFNPNVNILETSDRPGGKRYHEAVFTTRGDGNLEMAPDWIKAPLGKRPIPEGAPKNAIVVDINQQNINTWNLHESDGHIMEVEIKNAAKASELEKEAAARLAEAGNRANNLPERPLLDADALDTMNKGQLIEHAEENHGLELDSKLTKAEIISAIVTAQAKDVGAKV
jgi:hypothetical protein